MSFGHTSISNEHDRIRRRLSELLILITEFRRAYEAVVGDEVRRFEFLCDQMFNKFFCPDAPLELPGSAPFSNLDTGDSLARPFPPFVMALKADVETLALDAHHYYQPGSIESLSVATIEFLIREKFLESGSTEDLRVLPAAGTVQIYDALCRVHIETEDDTILVPELGYGFFLTQPGRVGGRVAVVECDERGAISKDSLAGAIDEQNERLWRDWKQDGFTLFTRAVRRLSGTSLIFSRDGAQEVLSSLYGEFRRDRDAWRSQDIVNRLADAFPVLAERELKDRLISALRPPRVVALLHIQPSVSGYVYAAPEADEIADVLNKNCVVAFEDIAYHSIRCRLADLASLRARAAVTYTLVGVSKPMAIANLRLGLLIVDKDHEEAPKRALESTTGFVSSILQRALVAAFRSDDFGEYATWNSCGVDGYDSREELMYKLLTGGSSGTNESLQRLVRLAAQSEPTVKPFIGEFLAYGLSRWIRPVGRPVAGFFYIVSCSPILSLRTFQEMGIRSSFDVFALLAYLFDFRTIPEEGMRPGSTAGTRLRLAFSPDPESVALLFLRTFAGLSLLEMDQ